MSSGFVSENDLEAARQKRQEEWDKVRKPDEPEEAPEEEYDPRSLFERLEDNKRVKQEEWDREHDIKNVVRGIDDDEAEFLDKVDDVKAGIEYKRIQEERQELDDYRKMKEKILEESEEKRLKSDLTSGAKTNKTAHKLDNQSKKQAKLLLGAVKVKKRTNSDTEDKSEPIKKTKTESLGALAGLGDYSSSDEET